MSETNDLASPLNLEEAKRYERERLSLRLIGMGINLVFVFGMAFAGGAWLDHLLGPALSDNRWLYLVVFALVYGVLAQVVALPVSYLSGYVVEHRYNLSNQTLGGWALFQLKWNGVFGAIQLISVCGLFAAIWYLGWWWWLAAACGLLLFSVVLSRLVPVFVPIFWKLSPVENTDLLDSFRKLSEGTGISVESVNRLGMSRDTKKPNAMMAGWGSSKKVLLGDTLIDQFPVDEIEMVVAHELGHAVRKHVLKGALGSTLLTMLGLYLCSLAVPPLVNLSGLPSATAVSALVIYALVLTLFERITQPFELAIARKYEREADWFSLERTKNPGAFKRGFQRMGRLAKSNPTPPRWSVLLFRTHPADSDRIAMADKWAAQHQTVQDG